MFSSFSNSRLMLFILNCSMFDSDSNFELIFKIRCLTGFRILLDTMLTSQPARVDQFEGSEAFKFVCGRKNPVKAQIKIFIKVIGSLKIRHEIEKTCLRSISEVAETFFRSSSSKWHKSIFDIYSLSEFAVLTLPKLSSRSLSDSWLKFLRISPSSGTMTFWSGISMLSACSSQPVSKFSSPLSLQNLHSIPGQLVAFWYR